jgi:hypothetical protein
LSGFRKHQHPLIFFNLFSFFNVENLAIRQKIDELLIERSEAERELKVAFPTYSRNDIKERFFECLWLDLNVDERKELLINDIPTIPSKHFKRKVNDWHVEGVDLQSITQPMHGVTENGLLIYVCPTLSKNELIITAESDNGVYYDIPQDLLNEINKNIMWSISRQSINKT